ncbi:MAG: OmpH family outer membrane protein [Pirellulales bacterium]|nr:OmpH family outer membrane protein [Pirellulales bacterium]
MTKYRLFAAAAALVLAATCLAVPAPAQQGIPGQPVMQQGPAGPIGLIDVKRVFENHGRFKEMMDGLDRDIQNIEQWIKSERDTIRKMNEGLKDFKAGTPEYKQLEQQVAERLSRLQAQVQIQQKEVFEKKAKIHYIVLTEVRQEVASIAAARGLVAVMQFDSTPIDRENPEDMVRDLNSLLVWHAPGVDITQEVLGNLARRMPNYGQAPTGSSGNRVGIPAPPQR